LYIFVQLLSHLVQKIPFSCYKLVGKLLSAFNKRYYYRDYRHTMAILQEIFGKNFHEKVVEWTDYIFLLRALKQLDFLLFPALNQKTVPKFVSFDPEEFRFDKKQGKIFIGYHLGNQNWFPSVFAINGLVLHTLREGRQIWLNKIANPGKIFRPGKNTREIIKLLRAGELLGLVGDVFTSSKHWVRTEFLGLKVRWPAGFARLARLARAEVYVFFSPRWSDGKIYISIRRLPLPDYSDKNFEEKLTKLYVKELENFVSKHPEQWLRWRYLKSLTLPKS